jgi:hypothetical protein
MQSCVRSRFLLIRNLSSLTLTLTLLLFGFVPTARARQHDMHNMPDMAMSGGDTQHITAPESAVEQAKRLADKRESEFNHHLAGAFIFLAGILILAQERLIPKWSAVRYAWPFCFLISGLFVLVFSDTEIWPWGKQTWYYALSHEPEDLQHKLFALILLVLALVEFQRLRARWKSDWLPWAFPALSLAGAVLLLFHSHAAGMHGPDSMQAMARIQSQHRWYALLGFGIVLAKGLSELPIKWRNALNKTWSVLLVILGASLALYTE